MSHNVPHRPRRKWRSWSKNRRMLRRRGPVSWIFMDVAFLICPNDVCPALRAGIFCCPAFYMVDGC